MGPAEDFLDNVVFPLIYLILQLYSKIVKNIRSNII